MTLINPVDMIIINEQGKILIAKRSNTDERFKNYWSLPGGTAEKGETFENALKREIKEELNCKIKWIKFFKSYFESYTTKKGTENARTAYFFGEITGKIKLCEELSEFKWINFQDKETEKLRFAFNQKQVLKEFNQYEKLEQK